MSGMLSVQGDASQNLVEQLLTESQGGDSLNWYQNMGPEGAEGARGEQPPEGLLDADGRPVSWTVKEEEEAEEEPPLAAGSHPPSTADALDRTDTKTLRKCEPCDADDSWHMPGLVCI